MKFYPTKMFLRALHTTCCRSQVKAQPQTIMNVFDRSAKRLQRERTASLENVDVYDYVKERTGYNIADRVVDITKKFDKAADLGSSRGFVSKHITGDKVSELILCDHSEALMSKATCDDSTVKIQKIVCDEEHLNEAFEPDSLDLVMSNLALHWVNNLPGCFDQVFNILKSDGVFIGCVFGNETLFELRSSLQLAEMERKGGISPHISPFPRPSDIGGLLQRSGFVMQTIDTDEIVMNYGSIITLMNDIKGMGESNAAWNRDLHMSRDIIFAAAAIYKQLYGIQEEGDDYLPATFHITNFIAWKPDPTQPKPIERGTGEISLKDVFKDDKFIGKPEKVPLD